MDVYVNITRLYTLVLHVCQCYIVWLNMRVNVIYSCGAYVSVILYGWTCVSRLYTIVVRMSVLYCTVEHACQGYILLWCVCQCYIVWLNMRFKVIYYCGAYVSVILYGWTCVSMLYTIVVRMSVLYCTVEHACQGYILLWCVCKCYIVRVKGKPLHTLHTTTNIMLKLNSFK